MKPFDKAAAMRGARVCTRDGREVRILCFDLKDNNYPICAAFIVGDREAVERFSEDGRFDRQGRCELDLMMADDDYLDKLERGEYGPTSASADIAPADPWDVFKREAAMELLRQRNGFVGRDIVEWVTSDVNRLVEGLKGEKE